MDRTSSDAASHARVRDATGATKESFDRIFNALRELDEDINPITGRSKSRGGALAPRVVYATIRTPEWEAARLFDAGMPCINLKVPRCGHIVNGIVAIIKLVVSCCMCCVQIPRCRARRRERESFALIITETRLAMSGGPGEPIMAIADLRDLDVEPACCWCCEGVSIWDRTIVRGADVEPPVSNACVRSCNLHPEVEHLYIEDAAGLIAAARLGAAGQRPGLMAAITTGVPPQQRASNEDIKRGSANLKAAGGLAFDGLSSLF